MIHYISRFIFFVTAKLLFGVRIYGRENIPKKGGFILASNHASYLDPPIVGSSCPRVLKYMARHDLFNNRLLAWWLNAVGCFPVKRDSADLSALKQAMRYVRDGYGLILFPEGTRAEEGEILRAQPGVGFLVDKLNVPVIPAFIKGSQGALPKGAKRIHLCKISVYFGKQICIERGKNYQEVADQILENIRALGKNS